MKKITKHLLEQYFKGKDFNIPCVIEEIFTKDGVVTFDINTEVINFPNKIVGASNISEQMFADFHDNFEQVVSYYVLDDDSILEHDSINGLHWIVVMREQKSGLIRVGTGYYNWQFTQHSELQDEQWLISLLHVHINKMIVFTEPREGWLNQVQSTLNSSWVSYESVIGALFDVAELHEVCDYLMLSETKRVVNA